MTLAELFAAFPLITSDAQKWACIRGYRDMQLAQSDWTQIQDVPLTAEQRAAWAVYRQALRDLPESAVNPDDVILPTAPEA